MRTFLLDYGAGNTLSVKNAVAHLGFELEVIETVDDFAKADRIIFPGRTLVSPTSTPTLTTLHETIQSVNTESKVLVRLGHAWSV